MATKLGRTGKRRTHGGVKKTFKLKKSNGKVLAVTMEKSCRRHLLLQKSDRQKKMGNSPIQLAKGDAKVVKSMMAL